MPSMRAFLLAALLALAAPRSGDAAVRALAPSALPRARRVRDGRAVAPGALPRRCKGRGTRAAAFLL